MAIMVRRFYGIVLIPRTPEAYTSVGCHPLSSLPSFSIRSAGCFDTHLASRSLVCMKSPRTSPRRRDALSPVVRCTSSRSTPRLPVVFGPPVTTGWQAPAPRYSNISPTGYTMAGSARLSARGPLLAARVGEHSSAAAG